MQMNSGNSWKTQILTESGFCGLLEANRSSIREVKDREFKLDRFKWLKEESVEDADDMPEPEEFATDAIM